MIHVYHVLSEMAEKTWTDYSSWKTSETLLDLQRWVCPDSEELLSPRKERPRHDCENLTEKCSPFENQKKKTLQAEEDALAFSEQYQYRSYTS